MKMFTVIRVFLLILFELQFLKSSDIDSDLKLKPNKVREAAPALSCMHKTYCEVVPNYPTDIVLAALESNPKLQDYANRDELEIVPQVDNEPDEEPLCVSTEQIIFPKFGITKHSEWKYIVNHETFVQSVRIETCLEEDKPCRIIEGFAEGYYTRCKQKYIYRQLLAVTQDGFINRDSFRFPASCCCHIEFQADKFLRSVSSIDY